MSQESAAGRDIGKIPPVKNPERRKACEGSSQKFTETYLIKMFSAGGQHWPWSQTHIDVFSAIDDAVLNHHLSTFALPRGGGKTSQMKAGALWAILYGYCRWLCLIAATAPKAISIVNDIQTIIETNPLLAEDFPEVCYPVARLERIVNRARGQTCNGKPTRIVWNSSELVFPDIPKSLSAQSRVTCTGLDGAGIRGQVAVLADGSQLRPDFVLIDDPQTDESAKSEFQTAERLSLLCGAVLDMAPPGQPLSGLMTVTVIREGDLADQALKLPQWHGIRSPMLVNFPIHRSETPVNVPHEEHWDKYANYIRSGDDAAATKFYSERRCKAECLDILDQRRDCHNCSMYKDCMDADAVVSWRHRKYKTELSAVQHAMNRHIRNPEQFASEMQQQPLSNRMTGTKITAAEMAQRVNGSSVGQIPSESTVLTCGIDVHDEILYYVVCAWESDFTGYIVQYGTYPEQPGKWFKQSAPPRPMSREFQGQDKDGVIQSGLERLCGVMLKHEFEKVGGGVRANVAIESMLVDSGYKPTLVYNVRKKLQSPIMQAARGLPLRATNKPISAYQKKTGWRMGDNWYVPSVRGTREYPHTCIDTNFWKTFVHRSLAVAPGTRGALTLYGTPATSSDHQMFCEHVAESEYFTEVFANGRVVCEYKVMPHHPDNHWLDCLVYATVAASMRGCRPPVQAKMEAGKPAGGNRHRLRPLAELGARP